jgi:hypothetical protein
LTIAKHFFSNPGHDLQKSFLGLKRTLLYEILDRCHDLISLTFPKQWQELKLSAYLMATDILLRNSDIDDDAFSMLITLPKHHGDHCFYIFIDDLDEYEENR